MKQMSKVSNTIVCNQKKKKKKVGKKFTACRGFWFLVENKRFIDWIHWKPPQSCVLLKFKVFYEQKLTWYIFLKNGYGNVWIEFDKSAWYLKSYTLPTFDLISLKN